MNHSMEHDAARLVPVSRPEATDACGCTPHTPLDDRTPSPIDPPPIATQAPAAPVDTVAPRRPLKLVVTFTPSATDARTATLNIISNAAGSPSVALTGTGTAVPAPGVRLAPQSLMISNQPAGSASTPVTVTLTNTGNTTLHSLVVSDPVPAGLFVPRNSATAARLQNGAVTFMPGDLKPGQSRLFVVGLRAMGNRVGKVCNVADVRGTDGTDADAPISAQSTACTTLKGTPAPIHAPAVTG